MSPRPIPDSILPALLAGESRDELDIMRQGADYRCMDPYLLRLRERGQGVLAQMDQFRSDTDARMEFMRLVCDFEELAPGEKNSVFVMPGFTCEYWFNISFGKEIFIAHNCFIADVAPVRIGTKTMIGPNVQLLTPTHPINPDVRNGLHCPEASGAITIGENVWIGGGVIILAGVTVGDGSTVGAGSVVTRSVPPRTVVVGNPARAVKRIEANGTVVDLRG